MTATLQCKVGVFAALIATFMVAGAAAGAAEKIVALTFNREANTLFLARAHELHRTGGESTAIALTRGTLTQQDCPTRH